MVTVTKLKDTNAALVESASLSSFEGLVREPPSPPQSAPSSRCSSRQGSRIGERHQDQEEEQVEKQPAPVQQAQQGQPTPMRGEEEKKKQSKLFRPLHSVISSLKKLPVVKVFA